MTVNSNITGNYYWLHYYRKVPATAVVKCRHLLCTQNASRAHVCTETDGGLPSAAARIGVCSAAVVSPGITGNAPDPDPTCAVAPTRVCPPAPRTTELVTAATTRAENKTRGKRETHR